MRFDLKAFLILALFSSSVEARTWRPNGQPKISGDFAGVTGDSVQIRTSSGIETVPYMKLSATDRAVVKSSLQSSGKADEAIRLNSIEKGESPSSGSSPSMADSMPGASESNERTWTDINGNQLTGAFVAVIGPNVQIEVNGKVQTFPVAGFSPADQQWINQRGADGGTATLGSNPGSMPGMPMQPGQMPPGSYPGAMTGSTMSDSTMPPSSMMPPGYPGFSDGMQPPGSTTPPNSTMPLGSGSFPGMDSPGSTPPSVLGYNPSGGPGFSSGGGPVFNPGMGAMPSNASPPPPTAYTPPEIPRMPGFSRFEDVMKCENCGAEFTEADGLKEGDACPKCSGGSSSRGTHFRSTRGLFKGIAAIIALAVGAISWIAKKAMGSN